MATAPDHGPLPGMLLALTVVSGLVDAFSYLTMGHVFVANMTGNVVFFGFALAGVGDISVRSTLVAIAAFVAGAAIGGRVAREARPHRGLLVAAACSIQAAVFVLSAITVTRAGVRPDGVTLLLVGLLAVAMGGQNAVVGRLGVPDLTTTVLTRTMTGLFAEASPTAVRLRRLASIVALMLGAWAGGMLLHTSVPASPLWLAALLLLATAASALARTRRPDSASWR
ncbi:YoaK family protein [Catellatospora sp. KI3]|uniref:YoaK family protein n=1 Tax=Catellatospora sp. KI3 TaxID=3041620 RepID=UPI0024829E55|nr:YoaK family protein [Catellatospora sp. KI3]MDI1462599.1 YoaK family protein [Catellatospora sp. KI3]